MSMMDMIFKAVASIVVATLGIIIRSYIVPYIKEKIKKIKKEAENSGLVLSQEQLNMAKSLIYPLVESAYRLKLQGKIEDAKERVLTIARTELSKVGIDLSDSMIDEIRRACLVELEMTITELKGIEEE